MRSRIILSFLVVLAAFALAGTAGAATKGDWGSSQLDAISSSIAGHPVHVYCEDNWAEWIHTGDSVGQDWSYLFGFTILTDPVIYVNADECQTLHAMLNYQWIGTFHASIALLTLAHESVHQRGIADEGQAECTALPMVPDLAVAWFGFPKTIPEKRVVSYWKRVTFRFHGVKHVVKVKAQKIVTVQVPDPFLKGLADDALGWHKTLPPEYQAC